VPSTRTTTSRREGQTFAECYDTDKVVPTDEYLAVYDEAVAIMKDLGVSYKLW
jgi:methylamine--corrinoid protein Co-methyltransferase